MNIEYFEKGVLLHKYYVAYVCNYLLWSVTGIIELGASHPIQSIADVERLEDYIKKRRNLWVTPKILSFSKYEI